MCYTGICPYENIHGECTEPSQRLAMNTPTDAWCYDKDDEKTDPECDKPEKEEDYDEDEMCGP